jgi:hypothetical protein
MCDLCEQVTDALLRDCPFLSLHGAPVTESLILPGRYITSVLLFTGPTL